MPPLDLGSEAREQAIAIRQRKDAPPAPSAADLRRAREMEITVRLEQRNARHD
jgi:hypothetical protein